MELACQIFINFGESLRSCSFHTVIIVFLMVVWNLLKGELLSVSPPIEIHHYLFNNNFGSKLVVVFSNFDNV